MTENIYGIKNGLCFINRSGLCYDKNEIDIIPKEEINLCKHWIKIHILKQKTISHKYSSYYFKHRVEEYYDTYISNGAFIKAAIELGYEAKACSSLNAEFNMKIKKRKSQKKIQNIQWEVQQNGNDI